MELNFDKEMDALLRQSARHETNGGPPAQVHLDADELAAFSANALPVKARARAMEHLVDCGNCRTILSNLVFFENREQESSAAFAASVAAPPVTAANESSLIERILGVFKFPTLAYGMAALVLLFTGAIGLMVFRNNSAGTEVAQLTKQEQPSAAKVAAAPYQETLNSSDQAANTNAASISPGIASAANTAVGGAFSVTQRVPSGDAFGTSSSTVPAGGPDKIFDRSDAEKDASPKAAAAPMVLDGVTTSAPPPPPATGNSRQAEELPALAKPQNPVTEQQQMNRTQDYRVNNNVQNNVLVPDGSDKDRSRRAVTGEVGAGMPREAARDEKEKADDAKTASPAKAGKNENKKAAEKRKKKSAAANAAEAPAATPTPSPEKKKPDEEKERDEMNPCFK